MEGTIVLIYRLLEYVIVHFGVNCMASPKRVLSPPSEKYTELVMLIINPQYEHSTISRNAGNVYHTTWHYNSEDSNLM
jgi:hypothetical protein